MNMNRIQPHSSQRCFLVAGLLSALLFFSISPASAQQSIAGLLEEKGVDWIVGSWTGVDAQGQSISLEYELELEGHALELELTVGGTEYEGFVVRDPRSGMVTEVGVNNQGAMTHATWRVEGQALVSERTGITPEGNEVRVAVFCERIDDGSFRANLRSLSPEGSIGDEILETITLERADGSEDED
jgi:hypothetical protein